MAELAPLTAPGDYRLGFAGDTFNTAWYLRQARPDAQVSYLSAVGRDPMSEQMLAFMERAGIKTDFVARIEQRSVGLYLIALKDGERSFSYWRDASAARLLAEDEAMLTTAIQSADLIYFSGITIAILTDAARLRLLRVLAAARAQGRTIAFDPNLRPQLWADLDNMRTAVTQAAAVSDIVMPSFEDEAAHFSDATPQDTAERYLRAGATSVIVKNGAAPIHFAEDNVRGDVEVQPAPKVIDTTAAGDSFNAGFLATLDSGAAIQTRIEGAAQVAAQAISGKGALVPLTPGT